MSLDLVALSGLFTYCAMALIVRLAKRCQWDAERRRFLAGLAPVIGAALGFGLGAALDGASLQDALQGACGGALSVVTHQILPRLKAAESSDGQDDGA